MGYTADIDIEEITPLHEVRSPKHLKELVASMQENRWSGRPILVIERSHDYLAWTGSHRIPAAQKAGFSSIPCYVIQEEDLISHGFDGEWGHVQDYERLEIIKKLGDETALHIMWQEGRI